MYWYRILPLSLDSLLSGPMVACHSECRRSNICVNILLLVSVSQYHITTFYNYILKRINMFLLHMVWLSGSGYNIIVCITAHACTCDTDNYVLAALEQTTSL